MLERTQSMLGTDTIYVSSVSREQKQILNAFRFMLIPCSALELISQVSVLIKARNMQMTWFASLLSLN